MSHRGMAFKGLQSSVEQRFKVLIDNTCCPYAADVKFRCSPEWDSSRTVRENILLLLPSFDDFIEYGEEKCLDMFVVEIRDSRYINNVHTLASLLHSILSNLHKVDPVSKWNLTDGITTMEWNFIYRGVKLFVPTFAPFYGRDHTRYSHQPESAFVVLQPDHSFSRRNINSKSPDRHLITGKAKARCEKMGYKYDADLVSGTPKAVRYIHPLVLGQDSVKWWEDIYADVK
jgi:hypothetical protein